MKLLQDDSLIRRAAAQDAAAFEQLMLLHQKPVYNICWRMAGNAEDALDLSQEVFLKLWRTLAQYQFDAAFSTWLYRMTQNVCIDFLRKQKRQQHVSLTFSDDEDEGKELSVPDPEPLRGTRDLQRKAGGHPECHERAPGRFPRNSGASRGAAAAV